MALRRLRADGGTEMRAALERALKPLRGEAQRQIVLVTDGQIGFEDREGGGTFFFSELPLKSKSA